MTDLKTEVDKFGAEIVDLLQESFGDTPTAEVEQRKANYFLLLDPPARLRVSNSQSPLAELLVTMELCRDSSYTYLAVANSKIQLRSLKEKTPILRWEFERNPRHVPASHVHVHGHRGALAFLLTRTGHNAPHSMESLHIPTGGSRFRPSLEDVIEFLIRDCKFDAEQDWEDAVRVGRERWRRKQLRSAVRDAPQDAAEALTKLGYKIEPPENGHHPGRVESLQAW